MEFANSNDTSGDDQKNFFTLSSYSPDLADTTESHQLSREGITHVSDVSELFIIPEDLSPAWQAFFDKVAAYFSRKCGRNKDDCLQQLKKRSSVMKEEGLSEFEMLMCSADFTQSANIAFKEGNFREALSLYTDAVNAFPTPDAMNNAAACALKLKKYQLAECWATQALDLNLLSPNKAVKAYHRRASARFHRRKYAAALKDANFANTLINPTDPAINGLISRIEEAMGSVKTPHERAKHRAKRPRTLSLEQPTHRRPGVMNSRHSRLTEAQELQMKRQLQPPVF